MSGIDAIKDNAGVRIALAELLMVSDKQGETVAYIERARRLLAKPEGDALVRVIVATLGKAAHLRPGVTHTREGT